MAFDQRRDRRCRAKVKIRLADVVPPLELERARGLGGGRRRHARDHAGPRAVQRDAAGRLPVRRTTRSARRQLGAIVNDLAERYTKVEVAASLDALKDAGFHWATRSGVTVSIDDVVTPADKAEILAELREAGRRRSRSSTSAV